MILLLDPMLILGIEYYFPMLEYIELLENQDEFFDSYILCEWIFILSSYEVSDFYAQRKCVSLAYVVWPCKTDIKLILRQVLLCEKISIMKLKVIMVSWNEDIHGKFLLVSCT